MISLKFTVMSRAFSLRRQTILRTQLPISARGELSARPVLMRTLAATARASDFETAEDVFASDDDGVDDDVDVEGDVEADSMSDGTDTTTDDYAPFLVRRPIIDAGFGSSVAQRRQLERADLVASICATVTDYEEDARPRHRLQNDDYDVIYGDCDDLDNNRPVGI